MIRTIALHDLSPELRDTVLAELREQLKRPERWLTYDEAAWLYGYSGQTLRRYVYEGRLRAFRRRGRTHLRHHDIRRMIAEKKATGSPRKALKNAQRALA